jgi:5-methylcytosine-specific restriction endonuclease McrA
MIRSGIVGKTGRIRLKGKALEELRIAVFQRDGFRCHECDKRVTWKTGHLAHIVSRGTGGSDTMENTRVLCSDCHLVREHNPKPCPKKPTTESPSD